MKHARARDLIPDYLEGDLDVPTRASLDRHLAGCPSCSEEVRSLRGVVGLLRGLPAPKARIDLAEAVMDRIAAGEGRPSGLHRPPVRSRMVGTLAAGVAGVALVWSFAGDGGSPPDAAPDAAPTRLSRNEPPVARTETPAVRTPPRSPGFVGPVRPATSFRRVRQAPRASAFAAGVAPLPEVPEWADASPEGEVDRQLEWLRRDPAAFLSRTRRLGEEHLARLARRAASRGEAVELAGQLMSVRLPEANRLQMRLMLETLAADMSRRPPHLD